MRTVKLIMEVEETVNYVVEELVELPSHIDLDNYNDVEKYLDLNDYCDMNRAVEFDAEVESRQILKLEEVEE